MRRGYPAAWLFVSLLFVVWIWFKCMPKTRGLNKYFQHLIICYCNALTTVSREISVLKIMFTCSLSSQGTGTSDGLTPPRHKKVMVSVNFTVCGWLCCWDSRAQQHQCNVTVIKILIGKAVNTDSPSRDLTGGAAPIRDMCYQLQHRLIPGVIWIKAQIGFAWDELSWGQWERRLKRIFKQNHLLNSSQA